MAALVKKIKFSHLFDKKIDGETKVRYFRFDVNALADFEQEVGMGFPMLMSSRAIFAATRGLLWAGLKHEDRRLTIQRVGELIQMYITADGTVDELLQAAMGAAVEQGALGKADAEKPEEDEDEDGDDAAEGEKGDPPSPSTTEQD